MQIANNRVIALNKGLEDGSERCKISDDAVNDNGLIIQRLVFW